MAVAGTILHVTDCYTGGVKQHIDDVRAGLALQGVRQVLVGLGSQSEGADHRWPYSRRAFWRIPKVLRRLRSLVRDLEKDGPVVIHGQSTVGYWFAGMCARFRVVSPEHMIATPHGHHALMRPRGLVHRVYAAVDRLLVPRGATWVAVSPDERELVEGCHLGRYDIRTIRNGVAPVESADREARRDIDVLLVGRLAAQKNLEYALEIARYAPAARFVLVGSGPLASSLKKRAAGLPNVEFAGFVPSTAPYYEAARLFLSTAHYEAGIPYTMMEALRHGCAVASTPSRGVVSGLDAVSAVRMPGNDARGAAKILLKTLRRPPTPHLPTELTLDRMLSGYRELYGEKLSKTARVSRAHLSQE